MVTWSKRWAEAKRFISKGGSDNRVAGILDVSRQAISVWETEENIPVLRALQIEYISKGEFKWRELSPRAALEVDRVLEFYPQ